MGLDGDQVRLNIVDKRGEHWSHIMEHELDGSELARFIIETKDGKEWGGAEQIIHEVCAEVHSFGTNT
eukprot:15702056-Heterocapsa_arctica.AAC.1